MRIERLKWKADDMGLKGRGGLNDAFDDAVKSYLRITDDEYDYLCENASEEELDLMISIPETFVDKRKVISFLTKYLNKLHETTQP
jgi:hypothetical protein